VVPASEIRGQDIKSVGEAREAFGVNLAVTGSVQRVGRGFRLTMNLVDTESQRQLKSEIIDDPTIDASVLQDETTIRLANMLNVELLPETREIITAGGTRVAGAHELYLEGRGYLQRRERPEDLDRVIELFDRAVARDSSYALAYAGLGEAYWRKYAEHKTAAFVDLAKNNCNRAIEINDRLSPVHITLGIINRGTGNYDEAIENFRKALELDPASYDAHVELAIVYKKLDWVEEAEETYLNAIELRPEYWLAYQELGVFYYELGRLEEAADMMLKVTEIVPKRVSAYNNLFGFYFMMGDKERTVEMFERLIRIEPTADAYSNMAAIYIYWGRSGEAIPLARAATELEGQVPALWGNLGDAYRYTPGYEQQASEAYCQAVALCQEQLLVNPRDARLRAEMACYNAKLGEHAKAVAGIETACAEAHGELQIMVASIVVYELAGQREDALHAVEKIVAAGAWTEQISSDPELVELRRDARYLELVAPKSEPADR
jgi:tetratricopeptide (TPR) repeat protein